MFFWKKKSPSDTPKGAKDIDVQWGGYYAVKEHGAYRLLRLLDFYQGAYHVQQFEQTFDHVPTITEATALKPTVIHEPRDTHELLKTDLVPIGPAVLNVQDLAGYNTYLQQKGYEQVEIDQINERVIFFSKTKPTKIRLTPADDKVLVTTLQQN